MVQHGRRFSQNTNEEKFYLAAAPCGCLSDQDQNLTKAALQFLNMCNTKKTKGDPCSSTTNIIFCSVVVGGQFTEKEAPKSFTS